VTEYKRREIQALRGLAVISVVLFHFFPRTFPNGFLGVDVFFVISGFVMAPRIKELVTSSAQQAAWKEFYIRRFLRLAPALGSTLMLILLIILILKPVSSHSNYLATILTSIFSLTSPFVLTTEGNYFTTGDSPVIHLWSLAVEEQFYIVVPVALFVIYKVSKRFTSASYQIIVFIVFCMSFVFYLFLSLTNETWDYIGISNPEMILFYLFPFRIWQFILGMIAFTLFRITTWGARTTLISFLFLLIILLSTANLEIEASNLLLTVGTSLLTFLLLQNRQIKFQAWYANPLAWFGDRSYSLYLLHMPLAVLAGWFKLKFPEAKVLIGLTGILAAILLANIQYVRIEEKYRNYEINLGRIKEVLSIFTLFPLLLASLVLLAATQNYFGVANLKEPPQMTFGENSSCVKFGIRQKLPCKTNSQGTIKVALVGDSHAQSISTLLEVISTKDDYELYNYSSSGCPYTVPFSSRNEAESELEIRLSNPICIDWNQWVKNELEREKFDVLISASARYFVNEREESMWMDLVKETTRSLKSTSLRVVLFGPNPELLDYDASQFLFMKSTNSRPNQHFTLEANTARYSSALKKLAEVEKVHFFNTLTHFCVGSKCKGVSNNKWLFYDPSHLSIFGAMTLESSFSSFLTQRVLTG
jgi:peptidoglycan/LPS O-acetylase OafA/YrhL